LGRRVLIPRRKPSCLSGLPSASSGKVDRAKPQASFHVIQQDAKEGEGSIALVRNLMTPDRPGDVDSLSPREIRLFMQKSFIYEMLKLRHLTHKNIERVSLFFLQAGNLKVSLKLHVFVGSENYQKNCISLIILLAELLTSCNLGESTRYILGLLSKRNTFISY